MAVNLWKSKPCNFVLHIKVIYMQPAILTNIVVLVAICSLVPEAGATVADVAAAVAVAAC